MRGFNVAMAVVVTVLVMVSGPAPCHAQLWDALLPLINSQVTSLWQNYRMDVMSNKCFYSQGPRIRSRGLYYKADLSCPTWTKIKGSALANSQSGVKSATIEDFIKKVTDNGIVTEEEAKEWLEGYRNI